MINIIVPLNNEKINYHLMKYNYINLIKINTNDLNNEYKDIFYSELGKLLFFKNNLNNNDIIGIVQNRRFFIFNNNIENILNMNDIILPKNGISSVVFNNVEKIYNQLFLSIFYSIYNDIKITQNNLEVDFNYYLNLFNNAMKFIFTEYENNILKNTLLIDMYVHNMFITNNIIFKKYVSYLNEKLILLKKTDFCKSILNDERINIKNKKIGAWFGERILTLFVIINKFKIFKEEYEEFEKIN